MLLAELGWPESAAIITAVTTVVTSLTALAMQQLGRRARGREELSDKVKRMLELAAEESDRRWHVAMRKLRRLEREVEKLRGGPDAPRA